MKSQEIKQYLQGNLFREDLDMAYAYRICECCTNYQFRERGRFVGQLECRMNSRNFVTDMETELHCCQKFIQVETLSWH